MRNKENYPGGSFILLPGEVISYKYNNLTYLCHGSLSYTHGMYNIRSPGYREFSKTEMVSPLFDTPVLVVTWKGEPIIVTKNTKIKMTPYVTIIGSTITVEYPDKYPSLLTDPLVVLGSVIIGFIFFTTMYRKMIRGEETITIIDDIPYEQPPPPLIDEKRINKIISTYTDKYGYLPELTDIFTSDTGIPTKQFLKTRVKTIKQGNKLKLIITHPNYLVNTKTEITYKTLVKLLNTMYFTVKRLTPNVAIAKKTTWLGTFILLIYIDNDSNQDPKQSVVRGIEETVRAWSTFTVGGYKHMGYMFIVTNNYRRKRMITEEIGQHLSVGQSRYNTPLEQIYTAIRATMDFREGADDIVHSNLIHMRCRGLIVYSGSRFDQRIVVGVLSRWFTRIYKRYYSIILSERKGGS